MTMVEYHLVCILTGERIITDIDDWDTAHRTAESISDDQTVFVPVPVDKLNRNT